MNVLQLGAMQLLVRIEYLDALAHELGTELRRASLGRGTGATLGQTAGFLLRHAMDIYDELELVGGGTPLREIGQQCLRDLIARGMRGDR